MFQIDQMGYVDVFPLIKHNLLGLWECSCLQAVRGVDSSRLATPTPASDTIFRLKWRLRTAPSCLRVTAEATARLDHFLTGACHWEALSRPKIAELASDVQQADVGRLLPTLS